MAVQEAVAKKWKEVTGRTIIQGYGLTETSPTAIVVPLHTEEFTGTIGLPVPSTEVRICDDAGNDVPLGELGEICIRGPQVMEGYWRKPEETANVMFEGGWFRTGDIGRMDEGGFTYIEDRKKDMILVSGFNVYPNEIEGVVVEMPGVLEAAAFDLIQGYGLTETSPTAIVVPLHTEEFTGTIGLPVPSTEVRICDDAGNDVPLGELGEICIRGPQVMEGYWRKPEETANVMFEGGWFRTGDIGRMDEGGFTYIEDRKKDMILVSGFNVYPNEIEGVVVEMEGILEAAAIGLADEKSGEVVKLFVVKTDESITEQDVVAFCKENMTGYKVPKQIEFRDDLPKTNVGKILRRALRDE